ncbi:hypothetical protein QUF72_09400 [Desulfobacterales bacterium HSG2]|nr:hypothetical protein [Desulfobacterales bacterium HSG2]
MIFVWAASLGLDWQIQARRICQSGGSRVLRLAESKIKDFRAELKKRDFFFSSDPESADRDT